LNGRDESVLNYGLLKSNVYFSTVHVSIYTIINSPKKRKRTLFFIFFKNYFDLKTSVTDSPFGSKEGKYSDAQIITLNDKYGSMYNDLNNCKLNLYN
jgi:hypothetical protein